MYEQEATLRYVNRIRKSCGTNTLDNLPKGSQRSSSDCVIARALHELDDNILVFQDGIYSEDLIFAKIVAANFGYTQDAVGLDTSDGVKRFVVPMPKILASFVENFDDGAYPELVFAE